MRRDANTALTFVVLAGALAAGCASAPAQQRAQARRTCIKTREINSISALDDRHAFVKLSASRFYLLTLDRVCPGFELARTIGVADAATRVCDGGVTLLVFENPGAGPMRCRVERIDRVRNKMDALDLIESRIPPG